MNLRSLPSVDALSRAPALAGYPERVRVEAARLAIDGLREALIRGEDGIDPEREALANARELSSMSLRPAINLSGVILHTGLGRAKLAREAVENIRRIATSHSLLELEQEDGKRGDRQNHIRDLLCGLTGAEDAMVVNNAAAAVVLALSALARGKQVVLSRGQMVEIGGSFRMPDIVRESGCELVEVGCTNKTRLSDYEAVLSPETGAILRCHTSNFRIIGFTEQPEPADLAKLAHAYGVPCIDDMGTGCLVDTRAFGIEHVPTIQDSIRSGADLVLASGDKLLGGPQAGIVVGRSAYLDEIRKHPLARTFRIDKLSLAGLEATLRLYSQGREAEIPTLRYLSRTLEEVREMAVRMAVCVRNSVVSEGFTEIGGGTAPGLGCATWRLGLSSGNPNELARRLRFADPPLIARIEKDIVWLDPRTLDAEEIEPVCEVLKSL